MTEGYTMWSEGEISLYCACQLVKFLLNTYRDCPVMLAGVIMPYCITLCTLNRKQLLNHILPDMQDHVCTCTTIPLGNDMAGAETKSILV